MTTTIYYFTGTGNSLSVAKLLSEKIEDCELVPIVTIWEEENVNSINENVGFVFPLYWSGLPKIVYDFVERINLKETNYIFTIITSAGDITELPLQQLQLILNEKEKKLNAGIYITMPNNYIIGYDVHSEERQKQFFERAISQIESFSEIVKDRNENLDKEIFKKDVSRLEKYNIKFRKNVYESDKSFSVESNCSSCGICEQVCPVNNIKIIEGKPEWQHKCQQCLACINFCPEKSIQIGTSTVKTGRYHHPEIKLKQIINQKKQF